MMLYTNKVVEMLMELPQADLQMLLDEPEYLMANIEEVVAILHEDRRKQADENMDAKVFSFSRLFFTCYDATSISKNLSGIKSSYFSYQSTVKKTIW